MFCVKLVIIGKIVIINVYDFFVFITACKYFQFNKCTELNRYNGPTPVLRSVGIPLYHSTLLKHVNSYRLLNFRITRLLLCVEELIK